MVHPRNMCRAVRLIVRTALLVASFVSIATRPALAQPQRAGTLHVTVVDPSGAVIAGATVTVTGIEDSTKAAAPDPVKTSDQGVATVAGLAPGRYALQAEFPGFETRLVKEFRVRAGDNKQLMLLPIESLKDTVTVGQNKQEAAVDPRGPSFGTTLTREQLEALSDDPDELRRQLQDMAGPGAVIRVDSFEGAALPLKAQIRSIRISRDQFAAEYHSAGGISVEIITQPGLGPIRYQTGMRFRGGSMSGRSPFTPLKGPEQINNYVMGLYGTLVKGKSSFNIFANGTSSYETPNINIALGDTTRSEALRLRQSRDNLNVNAQVDYALTLDQTLRFAFNTFQSTAENLGIGEYDEEDRAYSTENRNYNFRVQHMGPLGRRTFTRTRLQLSWSDSESQSAVERPTIRVNDSFTRGGAQRAGGQHLRAFGVGSDLDYVRGIHTWRTGIQFDASSVRADDTTNYLGTFTFESLEAFEAGQPRSYTRRIGDPNIRYKNVQGAWYFQDDARLRRNLTLSAGMRYEVQTHVNDYDNVLPRVGITWAPFASGSTTLRSSWGIFNDWLIASAYEQTLRVDGFRQRELDIADPTYPDLPDLIETGPVPPVNRYLLGDDLRLPRTIRTSVGIDQRLARAFQSSATYSYFRGKSVLRGLNLNAPIGGIRPEPLFGNVIAVVSDASSRQHQLQLNLTVNPGALLPAFNAPLINWKRTTLFFNYTLGTFENNADGPFGIPATGSLFEEWGPAGQDIPHRLNVTLNNQIVRNLLLSFNMNASSGAPYTIRTGRDENGDLVFNDRPVGVGRNTERAAAQWTINPAVGYTFTFGRNRPSDPGGVTVIAGQVQTVDTSGQRFRIQIFAQAQNITNRPNYVGYSGTLTSRFFGQPTAVSGTRKVDVGVNLSF
jgi:hypothetical protein